MPCGPSVRSHRTDGHAARSKHLPRMSGRRCLFQAIDYEGHPRHRTHRRQGRQPAHLGRRPSGYSSCLDAQLPLLIASVKAQGFEGLVAKRRASVYEPGLRSGTWMKIRVNGGQEFVLGGFAVGSSTFDALIVGYYAGKDLIYVARTPNRFTRAVRANLFKKFTTLVTDQCPFVNLPEARSGRWGQGLTQAKDGCLPMVEAGARWAVRVLGVDRRRPSPALQIRRFARGQGRTGRGEGVGSRVALAAARALMVGIRAPARHHPRRDPQWKAACTRFLLKSSPGKRVSSSAVIGCFSMPARPCPNCDHLTPRALDTLGTYGYVDYYRCPECEHVWHLPKQQDGPPTTVAQGRSRTHRPVELSPPGSSLPQDGSRRRR